MPLAVQQSEIFTKAMNSIAGMLSARPILYGPDNRPVASYQYQRTAAKKTGSLKNWIPRRLLTRDQEALQREFISERAIDLANNYSQLAFDNAENWGYYSIQYYNGP